MAKAPPPTIDTELDDLPASMRWRAWMGRVEAVIFASPAPVGRAVLARVVGRDCNLDRLIADIAAELTGRPYELVTVAGGWQHRTRPAFAGVIQASGAMGRPGPALSQGELTILMAIAYFQPLTRTDLSTVLGRAVSRDAIAALRRQDYVASGPRSPQPGAPYTYVTTPAFLTDFGFASLRELPDMDMLEAAGLLSRDRLLAGDPLAAMTAGGDEDIFDGEASSSPGDNYED